MPEQESAEVMVISQLPPPVHGSTMMTQTFVGTCEGVGLRVCLVDRRFSTSVDEIGGTSIRKLLSAISLFGRLWRSLGQHRFAPVVFFTTNRAPSFWMDVLMSALLRLKRRNYIAYVHTSGYSELADSGKWQDRGVRLMLGGATSVVVLGESMRADVERFNAAVNVIPNTVAGAEPWVPSGAGSPQLLFLSNLIPEREPKTSCGSSADVWQMSPQRELSWSAPRRSPATPRSSAQCSIPRCGLEFALLEPFTAMTAIASSSRRRSWSFPVRIVSRRSR